MKNVKVDKGEEVISYWGVDDIYSVFNEMISLGAVYEKPNKLGGGLMFASLIDLWGNIIELGLCLN